MRPMELLSRFSLSCLVVVLIVASGAAVYAQVEHMVTYEFLNGREWGNSQVGYVCKSVVGWDGVERPIKHPTDTLRVYGPKGTKITIIRNANSVFYFFNDPALEQEVATIGAKGYVDFKCTGNLFGVKERPFTLEAVFPNVPGVLRFDIAIGVCFKLYPDRVASNTNFSVGADATPINRGPNEDTAITERDFQALTKPESDHLTGKSAPGLFKAKCKIASDYRWTAGERGTLALASVTGGVYTDVSPLIKSGVRYSPTPMACEVALRGMPIDFPYTSRSLKFPDFSVRERAGVNVPIGTARCFQVYAVVKAEARTGNISISVYASEAEDLAIELWLEDPF